MTINLNGKTRLFPLLGDPVAYARSPDWLSRRMAERGLNMISLPLEVPDGCLAEVIEGLAAIKNVDGFSLTMPHKHTGFKHCATHSEASQLLSVVSAVRRNADGSWHGHTTDGDAFVKAQLDHGATIKNARVLILGAGGAGSAIAISMLNHGAAEVAIHDIEPGLADGLVNRLAVKGENKVVVGNNHPAGFDLICNVTPLGMREGDPLPLDTSQLDSTMFVGDVVAGHGSTPLISAAREAGCQTADGDAMVIAVLDVMCDFLEKSWR
jgi:shikimate dehydrogenase